jgi:hypothetical protein
MTITAALVAAVEADTYITSRLHADSQTMYLQSSLGVGDAPADPPGRYIVFVEVDSEHYREVRETSQARDRLFRFWVYDDVGDFTVIDQIIERLHVLITNFAPVKTSDGHVCMDSVVDSTSGAFSDTTYHGSVKYTTARLTCNR